MRACLLARQCLEDFDPLGLPPVARAVLPHTGLAAEVVNGQVEVLLTSTLMMVIAAMLEISWPGPL